MPAEYAVGLDVGATKILAGVVDCKTGKPLSTAKVASPTEGPGALLEAIKTAVQKALDDAPKEVDQHIARIGLGLAGQVDRESGVLLSAPNLGGGVTNVSVGDTLRKEFGLPVTVGNDVEVAALGESHFGAGRDIDLFACVFVGTGIGGALVQGGKRFAGASGSAGEIGHMMVRAGGRMCGCGQRGHLEAYSSRTAIVHQLREEVEGGAKSSISRLLLDQTQRVKSKPLSEAVEAGDKLVVDIMTQAAHYLGYGLASLINVWNPQRIVLGGGVIDRIDMLFKIASETAKASALAVPAAAVEIVRAELGDYSGMVGAAMLE